MESKKSLFLQLQCCMLLTALTVLPQFNFGNLMSYATGVGMFSMDSIPVIICKLIGIVCGCMAIYKLYAANPGNQKPMITYILSGVGFLLVFLSIFGISVVDYLGLLALIAALIMSGFGLEISWKSTGVTWAYVIMLAIILYLYTFIEDTVLTQTVGLAGPILILVGLGMLKSAVNDAAGTSGIGKLKVAAILAICGVALGWIPAIGWIFALILNIVAFVFGLLGYGSLKSADSIGQSGREGAANLFISMIIMLAVAVIDIIPVVGGTLAALGAIAAIFLSYMGWKKIISSLEAPAPAAEPIKEA